MKSRNSQKLPNRTNVLGIASNICAKTFRTNSIENVVIFAELDRIREWKDLTIYDDGLYGPGPCLNFKNEFCCGCSNYSTALWICRNQIFSFLFLLSLCVCFCCYVCLLSFHSRWLLFCFAFYNLQMQECLWRISCIHENRAA